MVFNTIIQWVLGAFNLMVGLLPDVDVNIIGSITYYNTQFREALTNINWFFPVDMALYFLTFVFIIQFSIFTFKIIRYIAGIMTAGILK